VGFGARCLAARQCFRQRLAAIRQVDDLALELLDLLPRAFAGGDQFGELLLGRGSRNRLLKKPCLGAGAVRRAVGGALLRLGQQLLGCARPLAQFVDLEPQRMAFLLPALLGFVAGRGELGFLSLGFGKAAFQLLHTGV